MSIILAGAWAYDNLGVISDPGPGFFRMDHPLIPTSMAISAIDKNDQDTWAMLLLLLPQDRIVLRPGSDITEWLELQVVGSMLGLDNTWMQVSVVPTASDWVAPIPYTVVPIDFFHQDEDAVPPLNWPTITDLEAFVRVSAADDPVMQWSLDSAINYAKIVLGVTDLPQPSESVFFACVEYAGSLYTQRTGQADYYTSPNEGSTPMQRYRKILLVNRPVAIA